MLTPHPVHHPTVHPWSRRSSITFTAFCRNASSEHLPTLLATFSLVLYLRTRHFGCYYLPDMLLSKKIFSPGWYQRTFVWPLWRRTWEGFYWLSIFIVFFVPTLIWPRNKSRLRSARCHRVFTYSSFSFSMLHFALTLFLRVDLGQAEHHMALCCTACISVRAKALYVHDVRSVYNVYDYHKQFSIIRGM